MRNGITRCVAVCAIALYLEAGSLHAAALDDPFISPYPGAAAISRLDFRPPARYTHPRLPGPTLWRAPRPDRPATGGERSEVSIRETDGCSACIAL